MSKKPFPPPKIWIPFKDEQRTILCKRWESEQCFDDDVKYVLASKYEKLSPIIEEMKAKNINVEDVVRFIRMSLDDYF